MVGFSWWFTMGKKESKKSQNPPVQVVPRHLWHGRLPTTVASSQQSFPMSFGTQPHNGSTTVDGSEIRLTHQLRLVVYPIIYRVFIHPGWLFGISSINSSSTTFTSTTKSQWFCHCHVTLPPEGVFTHMSHVYIWYDLLYVYLYFREPKTNSRKIIFQTFLGLYVESKIRTSKSTVVYFLLECLPFVDNFIISSLAFLLFTRLFWTFTLGRSLK